MVPRLPNVPEEHGKRRQPQDGLEMGRAPQSPTTMQFPRRIEPRIESYYGPARGGALDTHRLDTPSGDRRGRGLLVQDAQPLDMSGSFTGH